jgi:hypothetical protein
MSPPGGAEVSDMLVLLGEVALRLQSVVLACCTQARQDLMRVQSGAAARLSSIDAAFVHRITEVIGGALAGIRQSTVQRSRLVGQTTVLLALDLPLQG